MFSTAGLQMASRAVQSRPSVGKRVLRKYQTNQYEELTAAVAAILDPSDSAMSATPVLMQKPTKGSRARMSAIGMTPPGRAWRTLMNHRAAPTSISQGTRNIPTVDTSFAVPYWTDEMGRLMRKGRVCFFLSFTMLDPGTKLAQKISAMKKKTLPRTKGVAPPN